MVLFCHNCYAINSLSFHKQKLWSSGRTLGSRLEGRGFDPCHMLDGNGVIAMPGSIIAPKSGSLQLKIRKIQAAKWGKPKNI